MAMPVDHEDREHAVWAPSSLYRRFNCIGSLDAEAAFPDPPPSPAALEGTECHEAADKIFKGMSWSQAARDLTEEQEWIVETYTEFCFEEEDRIKRRHGAENVVVINETRVRAPRIHRDFHGTGDRTIIAGPHLFIYDLKAGHHPVRVEYDEVQPWGSHYNSQLLSYALLTVHHHNLFKQTKWVYITIVQPRCYGEPQQVRIPIEVVREFQHHVVRLIKRQQAGASERRAGEWCKFCKAAGACPAARDRIVAKAKHVFDEGPVEKVIRNYKPEELVALLDEADLIEAHVSGVRAHVMREMERGRLKNRGWKLVEKRATYKWLDFDKAAALLRGAGIPKTVFLQEKGRTPLQIKKAIEKEGLPAVDFDECFSHKSSGLTLAREDDKREAVKPKIFDD